ncbi:MAG: hypothetical protein IIA88_04640 [Bacteroidetes bacterium]|nr:hypothetical protein [Bacteroidota bacterium]
MHEKKLSIVIDANPLLSALLGGRSRSILLSDKFRFVTTEYTTWEVKKYIPMVAEKSEVKEIDILKAFEKFPILSIQSKYYNDKLHQAQKLIGSRDPKDVDILALSLKLDYPIWTEDKDFEKIEEITLFKTVQLLEKIK